MTKKNKSVDNQQKRKRNADAGRHVSNNMLAFGTMFWIVASIFLNFYIYQVYVDSGTPSGYATAQGQLTMCINAPPSINLSNCTERANIYQNYFCTVNASDPEGFPLTYADNTGLFNISQNGTINFTPDLFSQEGSYAIAISVDDGSVCTNSLAIDTLYLNVSTCIEPNWSKFDNGISTNLSLRSCWKNITNLRLGIPNAGLLTWNYSAITINGYDLSSNIDMQPKYIFVNTSELPNLNAFVDITFINISLARPVIFRNGTLCLSSECGVPYTYDGGFDDPGNLTFVSIDLSGNVYEVEEGSNLTIWSDTDQYLRYNNDSVFFFANYSYANNSPIWIGACNISFNLSGNYSAPYRMGINENTTFFTYNATFATQGTYRFRVVCNRSNYYPLEATDTFNITNRRPVLVYDMPNETWYEDGTLSGRDLDDYFVDPDGDTLNYTSLTVANIDISIASDTHIYTARSDADWTGDRITRFTAYDPYNETALSNLVHLHVISRREYVADERGGGGGGSINRCIPYWVCDDWSVCLPTNISTRTCTDLTQCNTSTNRPNETRNCAYVPTCQDHIKNQGEDGVDCGGPCPSCPNCDDGIQNQGETDVDCGGLCKDCPNCNDGIQNQGEDQIDCGGPCPSCPTCEDGIMNQEEEGIDCGGPCENCEGFAEIGIERPFSKKGLGPLPWILATIVLGAAAGMYYFEGAFLYSMWSSLLLLFRRRKHDERPSVEDIEVDVMKQLDALEKKLDAQPAKTVFEELDKVMHGFIATIFRIDFSFTHEELDKDLKEHKVKGKLHKDALELHRLIEDWKFREGDLKTSDVKSLLARARKVVDDLAKFEKVSLEGLAVKRLQNRIKKTSSLIKQRKIEKARDEYQEIMEAYDSLEEAVKPKVYLQILNLRKGIQEGMKK
ncbi:MAG: hypothetical protein ABIC95_00400 [archaeon]